MADSRSGKDDISWEQSGAPTKERNRLLDTKDHIGGVAVLDSLAVHAGGNAQGLGVLDDVAADDAGAEGPPAVVALAQRPLAAPALDLPVAVGDVVAHRVAQDVVQRLVLGHVGGRLADDDDQLALVV